MRTIFVFAVLFSLTTGEFLMVYNQTTNMSDGQYDFLPQMLGQQCLYNFEFVLNNCNSKAVVNARGLLPTDSIVIKDEVTPEKDWVKSTGLQDEDLEMTVSSPKAYIIIATSKGSDSAMVSMTVTPNNCGGNGVTKKVETTTKQSSSIQVAGLLCSLLLYMV